MIALKKNGCFFLKKMGAFFLKKWVLSFEINGCSHTCVTTYMLLFRVEQQGALTEELWISELRPCEFEM